MVAEFSRQVKSGAQPQVIGKQGQAPMRCVGLGEALFDLLPTGRMLGGAPLNAAVQAHQLLSPRGGEAVVASRVGHDEFGDEVIETLTRRGINTSYIQRDQHRPTGTVNVQLQDGQPVYEITANVAWDRCAFDEGWRALAQQCQGVAFGTLAWRSAESAAALQAFLMASKRAVRLFDVNLRQTFFGPDVVERGFRLSSIAKLNVEELPVIAELLELRALDAPGQLDELRDRFELEAIMLTRGAQGLTLVTDDRPAEASGISFPPAPGADSVGAGDACTAAFLVGWMLEECPARIAVIANRLGAYVAAQPGGTPTLPDELLAAYAG